MCEFESRGRRKRPVRLPCVPNALILVGAGIMLPFCLAPTHAHAALLPTPVTPSPYGPDTYPPAPTTVAPSRSTGRSRGPSAAPSGRTTPAPDPRTQPKVVSAPASGGPGAGVTVTGSQFKACSPAYRVDLFWDGAGIAPFAVPVSRDGGFTAKLVVPKAAAKGGHRISAQCGEKAYAYVTFEVTAGGGPSSSSAPVPGSGTSAGAGSGSGWMIGTSVAGVFLVAALVGYLGFFRRRRGPRWTRRHVRAVMRLGLAAEGSQEVRSPVGHSPAVRLRPRFDSGRQTIEEADE